MLSIRDFDDQGFSCKKLGEAEVQINLGLATFNLLQ